MRVHRKTREQSKAKQIMDKKKYHQTHSSTQPSAKKQNWDQTVKKFKNAQKVQTLKGSKGQKCSNNSNNNKHRQQQT